MAGELRPAERILVAAIRARNGVLALLDSVRPRVLLPRSLAEYRRLVSAEVDVVELARDLGARRVRVVY